MIGFKSKGQLSLELILLIFGVVIAGTFVSLKLVGENHLLGNESLNIKKETMGLFITKVKFSSNNVVNNNNSQNNESNMLPDLIVKNISYNYNGGYKGDVYVTISNIGNSKASNFRVKLWDTKGNEIYSNYITLNPGESKTITFKNCYLINGGTLTAYVDCDNTVQESNEGNNEKSVNVELSNVLPDLIVNDISYNYNGGYKGDVYVTVSNIGNGKASNFRVKLKDTKGNEIYSSYITLNPGESKTITFYNCYLINGGTLTAYVDCDNTVQELNENNNEKSVNVELSNVLPDLIVKNISYNYNGGYKGDVYVTVSNIGNSKASNFRVVLWDTMGYFKVSSYITLNPGESKTITFYNCYLINGGTLTAYVDFYNTVRESNEGNNEKSVNVNLSNVLPDLIVNDISCKIYRKIFDWLYKGDVYVTVSNIGNSKASNFRVVLWDTMGYFKVSSYITLNPGESKTITFYNCYLINGGTLTAYVDFYNTVQELNENNNEKSVRITI